MGASEKKKKRIRLKTKKARKIFGTSVSRGPGRTISQDSPSNTSTTPSTTPIASRSTFSGLAAHALTKQLDGTLDFEGGATSWWSMRCSKGFGAVLRSDYDPSLEDLTRQEYEHLLLTPLPEQALKNAASFRSRGYERLCSSDEVLHALAQSVGPLSACIKIFSGIHNPRNGLVPMPKFWERPFNHGHAITLLGFDQTKQHFIFYPGWSSSWGDSGVGYLPFQYFDKYLIEAWRELDPKLGRIIELGDLSDFRYKFLVYQSKIPNKYPIHVIDVYAGDKMVAWVHFGFLNTQSHLVIDELFTMPEFRNQGLAVQILSMLESYAVKLGATKISSYIHVQDILSEQNIVALENLFSEAKGYIFSRHTEAFPGCTYRVSRQLP